MDAYRPIYPQPGKGTGAMERAAATGTNLKSYASFSSADSCLVDALEGDLKASGIKLARYEHDIAYQDDILAFIQELKGARFVFVVLSEKYFDSEICLLELAGISEGAGQAYLISHCDSDTDFTELADRACRHAALRTSSYATHPLTP